MSKLIMNKNNIRVINDIIKNSSEEEKEKPNNKFHQIIERDKEFILDCYRKQPYYKESISQLEKESKGIFAYHRLVKNSSKNKSTFLKAILKSIARVSQFKKNEPKKGTFKYGYKIPTLEVMRKKKLEIVTRNKLKSMKEENDKLKYVEKQHFFSSDKNIKKNRFSSVGINVIEPETNILINNRIISRINSGNTRKFSGISNNLDNISIINKNLTRSESTNSIITKKANNNIIEYSFPERKIIKFNSILDKCREEILHGKRVGGKFEKFTNNINDNLSMIKQKRDNKEDNNIQDKKIIEDKITTKQKYKLLEIEKFNELKRKIDAKISDNYVYFNRKEYSEIVKDKRKDEEYDLYLEDINKINEKLEMKKIREKEKLFEIENLLDDVYKKKKYLKNKIKNYSYNRAMEKEYEQYLKDNVFFDDKFFILDEKKAEENKGTLIPKLLSKKEKLSINKKNIKEKNK